MSRQSPRKRKGTRLTETNPCTSRYIPSEIDILQPLLTVATNSNMTDSDSSVRSPLPQMAFSELRIGKVLGEGGFSLVSEIQSVHLNEVYEMGGNESMLRKEFSSKVNKGDDEHERGCYVLKMLRDDLPEDEHAKGVVDLAIEAKFLATLVHPNIVAIRATANSDPLESKFFVILDLLESTLDKKMNYWRKIVGENMGYWMGPCLGYCCADTHALSQLWIERLRVSRDIASAIRYLHSQKIIYRDLKPDNVGFNSDNQVKLFDFGLAKQMDENDVTDDELYMLTGNTGSLRYMAPEVANCEPYDQRVDTYSFGILFWQICSLTTPYAGYSMKQHAEKVVKLGIRPNIEPSWPPTWSQLMKECWSSGIHARPHFDHIVRSLDTEVATLLREDGGVVHEHEHGRTSRQVSDIKAKTKKYKHKSAAEERLDVDTRIKTDASTSTRVHNVDIV